MAYCPTVKLLRPKQSCNRIIVDEPGVIGWGGNSGFHMVNAAIQFGSRRIVLLGFDMQAKRDLHWHGRHGDGLNNPTVAMLRRWCRRFDAVAPAIAAMGVNVINATAHSALTCFPRRSVAEALEDFSC